MLSLLVLSTLGATAALGQSIALADRRFDYNNLPFMVDTSNGPRGIQTGYNRCNATTEGAESRCQTSYVNSMEDFCLWGPPELGVVGDTEGEMVAWCTRPGRGTRLIPAGALQAVQFIKTPDYIQVTGRIDQTMINIVAGDSGGEMDPRGADGRGNPLGGLLFSNAFNPGAVNGTNFRQVIDWTNFMGGNRFCIKVCDPSYALAPRMCEHIYDRIGCDYNMPAAYLNNTFLSCLGDNQQFPGVYVSGGRTLTYTQPEVSLGAITTIPYTPTLPATSQCTTFQSAALYAAQTSSSAVMTASSAAATGTGAAAASGSRATAAGSAGATATSAGAAATSAGATAAPRNAGMKLDASVVAGAGAVAAFVALLV